MSTTPASADATPTELNAADAFGEDESGERDGRHRVEGREDSHDADLTEARGRGEGACSRPCRGLPIIALASRCPRAALSRRDGQPGGEGEYGDR
jgi:hypothetical protein